MRILDCTLRDGGYYNAWDFSYDLIQDYLSAMLAVGVDVVEIGFRFWHDEGFKGGCAYSSDEYIRSLKVPQVLKVAVMLNASDLLADGELSITRLRHLFPESAQTSPVKLVRIACHPNDFLTTVPVSHWLKDSGFEVGFNLMQISELTEEQISSIAGEASKYPIDVLYFADSLGSLIPTEIENIVDSFRKEWDGELGIHAHDNLGLALQNSLMGNDAGIEWIDSTVTGMGRGAGNTKTEQLVIEMSERLGGEIDFVLLIECIKRHFMPLKREHGWGSNIYYYLAGKFGVHPTYIQKMMGDDRYSDEDIITAIDYLKLNGGKKYCPTLFETARHAYEEEVSGEWDPKVIFDDREVLLLGTGPSVKRYKSEIERYIRKANPVVAALNTQSSITQDLIDLRFASHPVRMMADVIKLSEFPQPMIVPHDALAESIKDKLYKKVIYNYGLQIKPDCFEMYGTYCVLPAPMVAIYAIAAITMGNANKILLAGFDGYGVNDMRNGEMNLMLEMYKNSGATVELVAVTPTTYAVREQSIYAM